MPDSAGARATRPLFARSVQSVQGKHRFGQAPSKLVSSDRVWKDFRLGEERIPATQATRTQLLSTPPPFAHFYITLSSTRTAQAFSGPEQAVVHTELFKHLMH